MKANNTDALDALTLPLGRSSMIRASAGTGKTYTITILAVRLLLGDFTGKCGSDAPFCPNPQAALSADKLLIVTFTNAAAAELRARVRACVHQARLLFASAAEGAEPHEDPNDTLSMLVLRLLAGHEGEQRQETAAACAKILDQAERGLDDAAICTIHSFCDRALNKIFSFESGEPFENELTEDISEQQDEAAADVMRSLFYTDEKSAGLLDLLSGKDDQAGLRGKLYGRIGEIENVRASRLSRKADEETDGSGLDWMFRGYRISGKKFREAADPIRKARSSFAGKARQVLCRMAEDAAGARDNAREGIRNAAEKVVSICNDHAELLGGGGSSKTSPFKSDIYKCVLSVVDQGSDAIAEDLGENINFKKFNDDPAAALKKKSINDENANAVLAAAALLKQQCEAAAAELNSYREAARTLAAVMILERRDEICRRDHVLSFNGLISGLDDALYSEKYGSALAGTLRSKYPAAMIDESQDTDPTQYSIFNRIYLNEQAKKAGARCLFIGDPKQSIYAFRNADIHSYNLAGNDVGRLFDGGDKDAAERSVLKLPVNYRSCEGVVESVNDIFGGFSPENPDDRSWPFSKKGETADAPIPFERSGFKTGKWRLRIDGREPGCVATRVNNELGQKHSAASFTASAAADDIASCLKDGVLIAADGAERKVRPSDITVLVSSGYENKLIAGELRRRGIASVYFSDKGSVLTDETGDFQEKLTASAAAANVLALMEAMADYQSQGKVKRLLGTRLAGLGAEAFARICSQKSDGSELENETAQLRDGRIQWEEYGFLSAFSTWCYRHGTIGRIEGGEGGERFLTDCFHIAEIMQDKRHEIPGIRAQIKWLESNSGQSGTEVLKRRLESENEQVKVYTIHKSKGLEFPVVFLPFIWCGRSTHAETGSPVRYYDSGHGYRLDLDGTEASVDACLNDEDEEACRLLYVALTRASAANWIYLGNDAFSPKRPGALALVLSQWGGNGAIRLNGAKGAVADDAFNCIQQGAGADNPHYMFRTLMAPDQDAEVERLKPADAAEERGTEVEAAEPGMVGERFTISSYTAVTRGLHEREFDDGADEAGASRRKPPRTAANRFNFPRGTEAGTFLHEALEQCRFNRMPGGARQDPGSESELESFVRSQIPVAARRGLLDQWAKQSSPEGRGARGGFSADFMEPLKEWFRQMVGAKILDTANGTMRLCDLQGGCWIPEMEYLVPAQGRLDTAEINKLCLESAEKIPGLEVRDLVLDRRTLHGYVTGSLDLVARLPGRTLKDDLYFVADYKSNYLGPDAESYSPDRVRDNVFDPHNRYDVQYLFYTLALHRFLASRLGDSYDYGRNFGGVLYLYLRGLGAAPEGGDGGGSPGVFFTKPDFGIVQRLDGMFRGRRE
jgi:exodeoxyribonuclease V beta subunit